ncbi:MAG TPA: VWA domain-containing protein [Thermoanaerobaculia bacterium]|nr:VWA domain-containing protein [Thermoanaerobaculia bacterium]
MRDVVSETARPQPPVRGYRMEMAFGFRSACRRGIAYGLAAWALAGGWLSGQTPPGTPRSGGYREEARVERVVIDAHVTDGRGESIPGLERRDFRVVVDGRPVPLESVEWVPAGEPEVPSDATGADAPPGAPDGGRSGRRAETAPGRLLIFFFQTDYTISRLVGLVRMGLQARRFLDTLLPTDRVAVLSFDSHLKLRQDFTADRARILAGIHDALRTGPAPAVAPEPGPSLARHFDYAGARRAVTPERALALIAGAAEPILGGKSLLFFGWGLGTIGGLAGPNPRDQIDYADALPALARARITIFSLDVTNADYHSLEGSLANIADLTGGAYAKTHIFPGLAMERVRRAISGRYVLVFRKPEGPRGFHETRIALVGRKGTVFARRYYED